MAYLQELTTACSRSSCASRAVVELLDWRNESRGKFCRKHGRVELERRNAFEATHNRDGTRIAPGSAS